MESTKKSFFGMFKDINLKNFDSKTLVNFINRNILIETKPKDNNIEDFEYINSLTQNHSLRDNFVFQKEYEINPFFISEIFKTVKKEIENKIDKKLNNFNFITENLEKEPLLKDKILVLQEQYKFTLNQIQFKKLMDEYMFYKGSTNNKYYKDWDSFVRNSIDEEIIIFYLNGDNRYKSISSINEIWEWLYQTKVVTEFCLNEIKRLESEIIISENGNFNNSQLITQKIAKAKNLEEDVENIVENPFTDSTTILHDIGFFELELVKNLSEESKFEIISIITGSKLKNTKKVSLPQSIAMLKQVGFFTLDFVKNLPKASIFEMISRITGKISIRSIKGNVNVLDAYSTENTMRYTSHMHLKEMSDILKSLN